MFLLPLILHRTLQLTRLLASDLISQRLELLFSLLSVVGRFSWSRAPVVLERILCQSAPWPKSLEALAEGHSEIC